MSGASRRRLGPVAVLAALALAAGACGGEGATVQGVNLVHKGRLTSCAHLPHPPFQMEQGGKVVGFDVDMLDLVAKRLGVAQHVVNVPYETMTSGDALRAQRCDVVMGVAVTPGRAGSMSATKPYFAAVQALVARKGSGIGSLADVKARDLRLGAQTSSTGEKYVEEKDFEPRSYDTAQAQLEGLRTGRVDVAVQDYAVARGWLRTPAGAGMEIVATFDTGERYGFFVRRDENPELVKLIDQVIDKARADGTYQRVYQKWIGPMPKKDGGATPRAAR